MVTNSPVVMNYMQIDKKISYRSFNPNLQLDISTKKSLQLRYTGKSNFLFVEF